MPLPLAHARTIHKFQGLSAGPVDAGKIPNPYNSIICDPDCKTVEATNIGMFYTLASRATTYGDENRKNSTIYFTGKHFCEDRFTNMCRKKDNGDFYLNYLKRDKWVKRLKSNEYDIEDVIINDEIIRWANTTEINANVLQEIIND